MKKLCLILVVILVMLTSLFWLTPGQDHQSASAQTTIDYYFPLFYKSWQKLTSTSYYMITIDPTFHYDLGCEIGARDANATGTQDSVVVLEFSYPVCNTNDTYGAHLYHFGPASLSEIITASENFALGYYQCSAQDTESNLVIGIGTNNRPDSCETSQEMTAHGAAWAEMVNEVNQWLINNGYFGQVQAYGANDIEVGYNTPALSRDWIVGYQQTNDYPLIHFGDAAGCPYEDNPHWTCGGEWSQEDVWYVSWGAPASIPLPLIYLTNGVHAQQWAYLSQYSVAEHGSRMDFTGVFTQWQACEQWGCSGTDNTPEQAYQQMYYELNRFPETAQDLNWSTDIRWILREEAYPEIYGSAESNLTNPLPQIIESLQVDLTNRSLNEQDRTNLSDKLTMLENLIAAIELARENPADKSIGSAVHSTSSNPPEFVIGLQENGDMAGLPYGAILSNVWQSRVDDGYLQIGAGSAPGIPNQGALYILLIDSNLTVSETQLILLEEDSGSLSIIDGNGSDLLLESGSGEYYRFDIESWEVIILEN